MHPCALEILTPRLFNWPMTEKEALSQQGQLTVVLEENVFLKCRQ